jgi:cold shock CspA family protein
MEKLKELFTAPANVEVSYDVEEGQKGLNAINVKII